MSLESGSFIKDFVITNPEGTDPKSQGDDHLRLIKSILKSQFGGLTQGKAIALTEDMINQFGGAAVNNPTVNIDTAIPYHCIIGISASTTGTKPPGASSGDVVINYCYQNDRMFQVAHLQTGVTWRRQFIAPNWSGWIGISAVGVGQAWQNLTASRAIGTNYVNNTGRPIQVSVSANATAAGGVLLALVVGGVTVAQATTTNALISSYVCGIVPIGAGYAVGATAATSLLNWAELR